MGYARLCCRNSCRYIPFSALGDIIGPFLGAFLGEIMGGNSTVYACKSGLGAFLGFITGTLFKLAICIYFTFYFISALV